MHVVWNWPHVVEEFRVDRPFPVLFPHLLADDVSARLGDRIAQGESLIADDDVGKSLIRCTTFVGRLGG